MKMATKTEKFMTVPEAAKLLGIGRLAMGQLLDEGAIEFIRPRHHRRVVLSSVIQYRDKVRSNANVQLAMMSDDPLLD